MNGLGVPLFVHTASSTTLPTAVPTKTTAGLLANDGWATRFMTYDAAMRETSADVEGVTGGNFTQYDGFGVFNAGAPFEAIDILRVPRTRTTTSTVYRYEDAGTRTHTTTETTDGRGDLLSRIVAAPDLTVARTDTWQRDAVGRLKKHTDPTGRVTSSTYDVVDQPDLITETQGTSTTTLRQRDLDFDTAGRLKQESIGSANAPATKYFYDARGRLSSEESGAVTAVFTRDSSGRVTKMAKTIAGNLRERNLLYVENSAAPQTIQSGTVTAKSYVRDGLDRARSATDFNLVEAVDSNSATFRGSRPALTSIRTFDTLGRTRSEQTLATFPATSPILPGSTNAEITNIATTWPQTDTLPTTVQTKHLERLAFTQTDYGLLGTVSRSSGGVGGTTLTFGYLGSDWTQATTTAGRVHSKTRNAIGEVARSALLATAVTTRFSEDVLRSAAGRIVATRTVGSVRTTPDLRGYSYDGLGHFSGVRTDLATTQSQTTFNNLRDEVLADEAHLVVTAADNTSTTSSNLADVIAQSTLDEETRVFNASYDPTKRGVPPTTVNSLTARDARDRLASDGTLNYIFDALDRLVFVSRGATEELRIAYDGLGRRRMERRRSGAGATGTTTTDVTLEYWAGNVIEESTTSTGTTGVLVATTYGPGLDVPLLTSNGPSNGTLYVLGTNARGDVASVILESTGAIVEEQELDAYGERKLRRPGPITCVDGIEATVGTNKVSRPLSACAPTATVLGRFGIGGARQHGRTKLVDLRNRVYATHLRMFLSQDPLGNVDAEGLYAYVAGDPVNLRDPWGLSAEPKPAAPAPGGPLAGTPHEIPGKYHWDGTDWACDTPGCDDKDAPAKNAAAEARSHQEQRREDADHKRVTDPKDTWPGPIDPKGKLIHRFGLSSPRGARGKAVVGVADGEGWRRGRDLNRNEDGAGALARPRTRTLHVAPGFRQNDVYHEVYHVWSWAQGNEPDPTDLGREEYVDRSVAQEWDAELFGHKIDIEETAIRAGFDPADWIVDTLAWIRTAFWWIEPYHGTTKGEWYRDDAEKTWETTNGRAE